MKGLKHSPTELTGDERARYSSGCITQNPGLKGGERDGFKFERGR